MGVIKSAIGDMVITFLWVFCASTFGLLSSFIATALGVQTVPWAPIVIITGIFFVFVFIFNIIGEILGGASYNATGNASFYAAGVGDDSLFSMALRFPAQAAGAVGGAVAIMEVIPEQYKHMIEGPSLQVDTHTGAIAEGVLTFLITFAVLLITLRGPQNAIFKTWLLAIAIVALVMPGTAYTGPAMNPAHLKPGLSYYAKDPQAAANSLLSLLDKAESVVPLDLRSKTPVRVGATAGLRALEGDASDRILQAVRELLKDRSTLKSEANGVRILDGSQEGSYEWVTINYLLGNLGRTYGDTVGIVDLGGGSVQMAYAISENAASKAPSVPAGEDHFVNEMFLKGSKYYLYVHSYLHYGLLAARAEILKVSEDSGNPCILEGFDGTYKYGGEEYKASAPSTGTSMEECRRLTLKALKVNSTCTHMQCTFGGVWNGGGGDGQKNLFVASFFFDRAAQAGFIKSTDPVATVQPHSFLEAAKRACETKYANAKATYADVDESNLAYICMDLVYEYTLLVDGFGLDPYQDITLVKQVKYRNSLVEAAWPLGSAIEAVSSRK